MTRVGLASFNKETKKYDLNPKYVLQTRFDKLHQSIPENKGNFRFIKRYGAFAHASLHAGISPGIDVGALLTKASFSDAWIVCRENKMSSYHLKCFQDGTLEINGETGDKIQSSFHMHSLNFFKMSYSFCEIKFIFVKTDESYPTVLK